MDLDYTNNISFCLKSCTRGWVPGYVSKYDTDRLCCDKLLFAFIILYF